MAIIIGLVTVIGGLLLGYSLEHGNFHMLVQPAEWLILGACLLGAFIISTPPKTTKLLIADAKGLIGKGGHHGKEAYLEVFSLLNRIFSKIRRDGIISIETDIENPTESAIFKEFGDILANKTLLQFICDNLRLIMTATSMPSYELEALLDIEIETNQHDNLGPAGAVSKMAEAAPGLGIVCAVLGVIITMGFINEPPEVIGHHIAAALAGTMFGVLLCYGILGPIAASLEHKALEKTILFNTVKMILVTFAGGASPIIALETGRRMIPSADRPSFSELEQKIRGA